MPEIPLCIADFSPGRSPSLYACGRIGLGFRTSGPDSEFMWLAVDGSGRVPEPEEQSPVSLNTSGFPGVDPVAPGWRLVMQSAPLGPMLISRDAQFFVALPSALDGRIGLNVTFARDADTLVILGEHVQCWFSASRLVELAGSSGVTWRVRYLYPTRNRAARDEGEVVISAYGRTNIRVGKRALTIGATPLVKGERVTLVDRLADMYGLLQYREIVRGNGERIQLAPEPRLEDSEYSTVRHGTRAAKGPPTPPPEVLRAFDAMKREGLAAGFTPAVYAKLVDPFTERNLRGIPQSMFEILDAYYQRDSRRALADGYIARQAEFEEAEEIEDAVADVGALVGGEPLSARASADRDAVRVRGSFGTRTITLDAGFSAVIDAYNDELKARGDARMFSRLDSDREHRCFLLTTPEVAERLRSAGMPIQAEARRAPVRERRFDSRTRGEIARDDVRTRPDAWQVGTARIGHADAIARRCGTNMVFFLLEGAATAIEPLRRSIEQACDPSGAIDARHARRGPGEWIEHLRRAVRDETDAASISCARAAKSGRVDLASPGGASSFRVVLQKATLSKAPSLQLVVPSALVFCSFELSRVLGRELKSIVAESVDGRKAQEAADFIVGRASGATSAAVIVYSSTGWRPFDRVK